VHVPVVKPERKTFRRTIEQPAHIEAFEDAPLYSRVPGYIDKLEVDMGDRIRGPQTDTDGRVTKPGQTLVVLFAPELQDDVDQKQALVAQADAEVVQSRAGITVAEASVVSARSQRSAARAAIEEATAHVDRYQSELQRFKNLHSQEAIDAKVVDESNERLRAAQAVRLKAQSAAEQVEAAVTQALAGVEKAKADLVASEARVRVAKAEAARARTMLDYRVLRAPFDGVVTARLMHTGRLVEPGARGDPVLMLARTDKVRIFLDVPETDAPLVDDGDEVSIRLPALDGQVVSAKVTRSSWSLNRTARTLSAEVELANDDGKLRPGMYAYANVTLAQKPVAMVLPASAVFADKTASYCACIEGGRIVRKPLKIGLRSSGEVEIIEGLRGDEQVVRANASSLAEGQSAEALTP
jgi:RND family efflux transporter MFP subunit